MCDTNQKQHETDQESVFEDRCAELGLQELLPQLQSLGYTNLGNFAYACPWNADKPHAEFDASVLPRILTDPGEPRSIGLRRLWFEAYTDACAELQAKQQARSSETGIRRLAAPERERRRKAVASKCQFGKMRDHEEPGETVVDTMVAMFEDKVLVYISPDDCPSRDMELDDKKPGKSWKPVKVQGLSVPNPCPRKLEQAWRRRGNAMEMGGLMRTECHDKLVDELIEAYTSSPADSRYESSSYEQCLAADRWVFKQLQKECRLGFRSVAGASPLEAALDKILAHPTFRYFLLPLPRAPPRKGSTTEGKGNPTKTETRTEDGGEKLSKNQRKRKKLEEIKEENKKLKSQYPGAAKDYPPPPLRPGPPGKGAGKSLGRPPMPRMLVGTNWQTQSSEPLCYSFGLDTCTAAAPGERCPKGWHLCGRCYAKDHATIKCSKPIVSGPGMS